AKMRADIQAWLGESSRTHTLASAEALLGLLQFGTHVVPNGRPYLSGLVQFLGMHAAAAARRRAAGQRAAFESAGLHPPRRVRQDLLWWDSILAQPVVSRSFANDLDLLDPGLYTDASGSGAGVVLDDRVAAYAFDPAWRDGGRNIIASSSTAALNRRQFRPRPAPAPASLAALPAGSRLVAYRPSAAAQQFAGLEDARLARVMEMAFAPSTRVGYGTGLSHFLAWCEDRGVDEELRCPA
ncbi:unnamed protein product, partial [Tilletia controversa]